MSFTEVNSVEQMVIDVLAHLGWRFVPAPTLPRQPSDVFVESLFAEALIKFNPEIAAQPDRAEEVIYNAACDPALGEDRRFGARQTKLLAMAPW